MVTSGTLSELEIAARLLERARVEYTNKALELSKDSIALSAFHLGLAWAAIQITIGE
jgi:hypothetical protein